MENTPIIEKLPIKQPGKLCIRVFQEEDPVQYFTEFTQRIVQSPTLEFKLLFKGTSAENSVASSVGSSISIQQVPEVLQKLKGTQFSLRCESQSGDIPIEIIFELYDNSIEFSGPDSLQEQVMSILFGGAH